MFSTFPDGWPGTGVLLLRATAGVGLIVEGTAYLGAQHERGLLTLGVALLSAGIGVSLLIGCLTRWAAGLAMLAYISGGLSWFQVPSVGLFETRITEALAVVIAAAVLCLGPGAFSVDARLFGRREVIIPKNPHDTDV